MCELNRRYGVGTGWSPEKIRALIPDGLGLQCGAVQRARVSYLDTFDWRVHAASGWLMLERVRGRCTLRWAAAGEHPYVVPVDRAPRFAADLPAGVVAGRLAAVLEMRALLAMGEAELEQVPLRVTDDDGNTLLRLWLEQVQVLDGGGAPAATTAAVRVQGLPGHEQVFDPVVRRLAAETAGEIPLYDLAAAAAVRDRQPGDYSSKPRLDLDPAQPAGEAVRVILRHLLETMRRNVDGVLGDIDSEFLHDLRVAVRRSRSVLGQLRSLFDPETIEPFRQELRWLGTTTGPCRDLDVYLLEIDGYRAMLPAASAAALDPLEQHLRTNRTRVHSELVRTLRSPRFTRLLDQWQAFLERPDSGKGAPPAANRPVREIADSQISRAYRRIVRRGSKLGDDPPADPLHRLRIDAKKLRYLLELFRSLYSGKRGDRLVKELKRIQDILGGFNDMAVQQQQQAEQAQELAGQGQGRDLAPTLMAMGRLQAILEQRQEELRLAFAGRFSEFANPRVQRQLDRLLGRGAEGSS